MSKDKAFEQYLSWYTPGKDHGHILSSVTKVVLNVIALVFQGYDAGFLCKLNTRHYI